MSFTYLYNRQPHTDTSLAYMQNLGMDEEQIESILNLKEYQEREAARHVRNRRDRLIRDTDFYMLPDAPNAPDGIVAYRQALRDIPQQPGFPYNVEWPEL